MLLMAIGAVVFAYLLFERRELLKARTQKLEDAVHAISATIENERPEAKTAEGKYTYRDTSECEDQLLSDDEISRDFYWKTYRDDLENGLTDPYVVDNDQLMQLYLTNELGEVQKDLNTRQKIMKGPGTMDELLNDLGDRCVKQYNQLNATRQELIKTRTELVKVIELLNGRKKELRQALYTITQKNNEIRQLNETIAQKDSEIANLNNTINTLRGQITDLESQVASLNETIDLRDGEIKELKDTVAEREARIKELENINKPGLTSSIITELDVPNGVKGTVASVNQEYMFAIVRLEDDEFLSEAIRRSGGQRGGRLNVPVWIRRGDPTPRVVARALLISLNGDEKLAVADLEPSWVIEPIKAGDQVLYQ